MPLFTYKAVNAQGETEEGIREAVDEQVLIAVLQADGYIPIRVAPAKNSWLLRLKLSTRRSKLSQKDLALFTGQLAVLLESGLPLDRSLTVLMDLT